MSYYSSSELQKAYRYNDACFKISDKLMTDSKALKVGKDAASIFLNCSRECSNPIQK